MSTISTVCCEETRVTRSITHLVYLILCVLLTYFVDLFHGSDYFGSYICVLHFVLVLSLHVYVKMVQIVESDSHIEHEQGDVIPNGSIIRLRHVRTRKWLHSHLHQSPISGNLEVHQMVLDFLAEQKLRCLGSSVAFSAQWKLLRHIYFTNMCFLVRIANKVNFGNVVRGSNV